MSFDPEAYSITIRKEVIDGDALYVGRVAEFPNISAFEASHDEARSLVLDAITRLHSIAAEKAMSFPEPTPALPDEFSGRITLRLPKSLHAKVVSYADREDVSLNTYLVSAISTYAGEIKGRDEVAEKLGQHIQQYVRAWFRTPAPSREVATLYSFDSLMLNIDSADPTKGIRERTSTWSSSSFRNIKKFDKKVTANG